jgi:hypothetical protein
MPICSSDHEGTGHQWRCGWVGLGGVMRPPPGQQNRKGDKINILHEKKKDFLYSKFKLLSWI